MVKAENKRTYKRTGAEGSKVCDIYLYKDCPTSHNNLLPNGQYSDTFLHCQNRGTHNKVLSDESKEIYDYLLANGIVITVE